MVVTCDVIGTDILTLKGFFLTDGAKSNLKPPAFLPVPHRAVRLLPLKVPILPCQSQQHLCCLLTEKAVVGEMHSDVSLIETEMEHIYSCIVYAWSRSFYLQFDILCSGKLSSSMLPWEIVWVCLPVSCS